MNTNTTRLVPITREMRDILAKSDFAATASHMIAARWDSAPADPVQVVDAALRRWNRAEEDTLEESEAHYVLRALGVPREVSS